jgi:hypothetical protein
MGSLIYEYCRIRFVGNGRFACGADLPEGADIDEDVEAIASNSSTATDWADYILACYRSAGLPEPELEIVFFESWADHEVYCRPHLGGV